MTRYYHLFLVPLLRIRRVLCLVEFSFEYTSRFVGWSSSVVGFGYLCNFSIHMFLVVFGNCRRCIRSNIRT